MIKNLEKYSLIVFENFATGEGLTVEVELLCGPDQKPTIMEGYPLDWTPERIPATVIKNDPLFPGETYIDWNPEFIANFLQCFGAKIWASSEKLMLDGHYFNLSQKFHFNLS